jgi:hypothetical protein
MNVFFNFDENDDIKEIKWWYEKGYGVNEFHHEYVEKIAEIYKTIPNYDNYEISNYGNVRKKNTGLILKYIYIDKYTLSDKSKSKRCTRYVILNKNGIRKNFAVWYLHFLCRTFG